MEADKNILNPANWVALYADELYGYAMSKTGKQELAEDMVQDTFLSALNAASAFKGNSSERTWLFTILKNKIADHYRKASTRYESNEGKLSGRKEDTFINHFFDKDGEWQENSIPKDWEIDYKHPLDDAGFQKVLDACLGKLPANWNKVIAQKFMEEKESDEICKELNLSPSNFWVIMHRAKLQLRECVEKNWFKLI